LVGMEKIILKEYHNNKGQLHSIDGPASIWSDGTKKWYINDKLSYRWTSNRMGRWD